MIDLDPERGWRGPSTSRRAFVQVGFSGLLGLGLPKLLAAREATPVGAEPGRAKSVIVILLSGGLGQHDSFDMKPEAPDGDPRRVQADLDSADPRRFGCANTCRAWPGSPAKQLAIVRSMAHPEGKSPAGRPSGLDRAGVEPSGGERPGSGRLARRLPLLRLGALDNLHRRSDGVPNGVALPLRLVEGPLTWPGQDAGFLGPKS